MLKPPVKTALCAFGMSGRVFHAPFIDLHSGFLLCGAYERSKKTIKDHYPGVKTFDNFDEILEDNSIELVIVNTPNSSHYKYAKKALLAGKNIVVEKVFVTDTAQGEELIEIATTNNLKIGVFQNRRWDSDFLTVKKVVEEGALGEIREVEFHFDRFNQQLSPKLHKEQPGPGAGIVKDLGPHIIDQALFLFGMPEAIFADISITRSASEVDDNFEIIMYYPNKRVRLKAGYHYKEPVPSFIVHGTKGSFLKSRADVQEAMLQAGKKPSDEDYGIEPETEQGLLHTETTREKIPTLKGNYMEFYNGVYKALRENDPMLVTAQEGLSVVKIIEAAFESSIQKKLIEL